MENFMKLKTKMIALSLIPSVILGIILFLTAVNRITDSVYDEAYIGMIFLGTLQQKVNDIINRVRQK